MVDVTLLLSDAVGVDNLLACCCPHHGGCRILDLDEMQVDLPRKAAAEEPQNLEMSVRRI
jgi:hypothetical protein